MHEPLKSFEEALAEVDHIVDRLDHPVDAGIKKLVAVLRMFGVRTTSSCEGHNDRGHPYPWIQMEQNDALRLVNLVSIQNRPKRIDGTDNNNLWVVFPEGSWLSLQPLDTRRSLEDLQRDADDFADWLRQR